MTEKRSVPADLRRLIVERAGACCEYCLSQEEYSVQAFSVEHIIPRTLGGLTAPENLAYSCQGCNAHKAIKTAAVDAVTETTVVLYNPRQQTWAEHFSWNADCTEIIGLTAVGRATIEGLHLNRGGVMNLRRVLFEKGLHPPAQSG
jgi:hypothetical protein